MARGNGKVVREPAARTRKNAGKRSKVALVCAGGGVTGAIYEIGCLRALEDLLDRSLLDFDIYVGVSGGAFVASLLANGISPIEMYDEIAYPRPRPLGVTGAPIFRVGASEYVRRALRAPQVLGEAVTTALGGEGRNAADFLFSLFRLLPSGVLDNSGIQEYLARVFKDRGRANRFDDLAHELYIVAVDLDTAEGVNFGEQGHRDVPISKAVQASTALPGFYRPVRIGAREYVDGGVHKTAHINLAIEHGADLVVCINPIVPMLNDASAGPLKGHLSREGIGFVLDQAFRIVLHGRMQYGLERYAAEHPEVDILLIEPMRDEMRMFSYNIMRYSARKAVARYGYRSLRNTFIRRQARFRKMLARHGIALKSPRLLPDKPPAHPYLSTMGRHLGASLALLETKLGEPD